MEYSQGVINRPLYETESGRRYIIVSGKQIKVPWKYGKPYGVECLDLKPVMAYDVGDEVQIGYVVSNGRPILKRIGNR